MKTVDLTPKIHVILSRLQEDKKDPVHALRVACKRIRALLLFGKSQNQLSRRIKDIKNSLGMFRDEDVWISTLQEKKELKSLEDLFQRLKRRRMPLRKSAIIKAKKALLREVSTLSLRGKPDPSRSSRRFKKAYKKYKKHSSPEASHDLRKKATILMTQLELIDKKPKKIRRLRFLKNLLGESRDIYSLREELERQKRSVPKILCSTSKQEKKNRRKILKATKKIWK